MITLTSEQESQILNQIEELKGLEGRKLLRKNDSIFKFLCALNANGFIDSEEYHRLDTLRYNALFNHRRT